MLSLETSFEYNQKLTKEYAKTFYFSLSFLKKEKRQDIYAIYGFCRYSDNMVDDESDLDKASKDLENWRKLLEIGLEKGDSDDIVLKSFIYVVKKYNIEAKLAFELLDGMEMDLKQSRFQTFEELQHYCYLVASVPGLLVLNILGFEGGQKTVEYASKLGEAMQLTNILRDIKEDYGLGRIYLPQTDLKKHSIEDQDFKAGKINQKFENLIQNYIKIAKSFYSESQKGIPNLSSDARFVVKIASVLYSNILVKIQKNNYDVFTKRISLSIWEKFWLTFKTLF